MTSKMYLEDLMDAALVDIEKSFIENDIPMTSESLRSIAICWSINTLNDGPLYYRTTSNMHTGRKLLELFSALADSEEVVMTDDE